MEGAQVDQDVNQAVLIGDGLKITNFGTFDPQSFGLTVDPFVSSPLLVDLFVKLTVPVKLIPDAGADAGGQGRDTAAFGPLLVLKGAGLIGLFGEA